MSVRIRRTKGPASPRPGSMAPCRPSLCSQLKVPWDSALKTVLPQLSVPQSANAAPDLPGLNLSTRPPPQTLAAVQQSGDGRGIEKRKERLQQQKKRKERWAQQELAVEQKSKKQFKVVGMENGAALEIERPLPLINAVFITAEGRRSHHFPFTSSPLAAGQRKRQFPLSPCTRCSIPHG